MFTALIVVCALAGLGVLVYYHRRYDGLLHYVWHTRPMMVKQKCEPCSGTGVEWYDGKKWGIIPRHLRAATRGRNYLKTNLANVRTCLGCHGKGFNWQRVVVTDHDSGSLNEPPVKTPQDD